MNAREYATKYAGHDVYYKNRLARVIGYGGDTEVCIEAYDHSKDMSWPIDIETFRFGALLVKDARYGWWTYADQLTIVEKPIVNVKPYPHKCSICRKPARIIGRNILCSNTKCKSQKALRATYKIKEQDRLVATKRELFLDNWLLGGCVLCGKPELMSKPKNRYAHMGCWNLLGAKEERDIRRSMRVYRKLKGMD